MKQLVQDFKTGKLSVEDFPAPALSKGMVLVETKSSLISVGTEKSTVQMGKAGLLGKAKLRPDLVKQVIANYKREGFTSTLQKVRTKLDTLKALGYSCSGKVIASMDTGNLFQPGDRVACAGQDFASHAEVVCIPQNLVTKLPDEVSFDEGAYTTLGAIAMQGIRQADPKIGESVAVIGLGVIGQLTAQILNANGCRVFAIDLDEFKVNKAKELGISNAHLNDENGISSLMDEFTSGYGFDQVIITASSSSNETIELAGEIVRKKGKVVVVGAVKMDIPRDPHYYRKEIDLRMACSYGPGRYDPSYEDSGIDYPFAYVRWTEQRNMQAFLDLVARKKVNTESITTHNYQIEDAAEAFDLLLDKSSSSSLGILINYPERENKEIQVLPLKEYKPTDFKVGFIGAGSFAQSYLIPNVTDKESLDTVVTSRGITSKNVADKFGFEKASTNPEDVISNDNISAVFIATHHNSHGEFALQSLKASKAVFVEKPLTIDREELELFKDLRGDIPRLMVGYNRRFSPALVKIKKEIGSEKIMANYRVNAGYIPVDSWIQDPEKGGGRILGEVCHFVDAIQFLSDSYPVSVYAVALKSNGELRKFSDVLNVTLQFQNGSIGNISYAGCGDPAMPKERLEVFSGKRNWVMDDFRRVTSFASNKSATSSFSGKGHAEEVEIFCKCISRGLPMPIEYDSILYTSLSTFAILDSLATGLPQEISLQ